ncbi:DUF1566 domain-containing protein [Psychroflexus salis]|uniref:Lcl C-terminal domain-containing protein n=1 Tax=Psychroflexus salis TaxID=1526574 RepID=A0A917EC80_9FLAO|nr:DUF1566 domain-containing protein [Psychroflexus salis]GGE21616.1 hypothetical protein GCM10010831_23350 [Psychroflexus salis]
MKTMKHVFTILISILMAANVFGQTPEKMSYQGVIRDSANELVANNQVSMQLSILQGGDNGNVVYQETQTPTTNVNGLVSVEIGTGTIISGNFTTIDWSAGPYFIKTETDPTGGSNYSITGTSQLMSVPYALYAKESGSSIPGPAGEDGDDGVGITSTTDNNDGTFTLNFSDGSSFTTSDLTGPQGPIGDPGNDGIDGEDGDDGVGITSTTDNNDGTFTLNFSDGSSFTTSDLTGPQGPIGAPGNDGIDGEDGDDGVGITSTTDNNDGTFTLNFSDGSSFTTSDLTGPQGVASSGNNPGDMLYWDGSEWVIVPVGSPGQVLQLNVNGTPEWMGSGYATITTNPVTNIGPTEADFSGDVTSDGGAAVTERGFVYDTSPSPNLTDNVEIVGDGTGSFNTTITGLAIGQTYYVRAYATNNSGTIYGNEVSFQTNSSYELGDTGPAGGLVFYDKGSYSDGWRYMEANPVDLSTGTDWGCSGSLIPGSQPSAIGNGPQNTQDIVDNCTGTNIAARLCNNYTFNGFDDWFLPARQELDQMYLNLHAQGLGSFNSLSTYWSSTENNNISAQGVSFNTGNTINNNKLSSYRVRAARRF